MSPRPDVQPWERWTLRGLVLAFVLAVFGSRITDLHEAFLGIEYVDHYGTQWFYWFFERAVREGEWPGHTDLFFYPWGKDIFGHTGANLLDAALAVPFRMLFGGVLGYNLFVLMGLALSGWAAWDLLREVRVGERSLDHLSHGVGALLLALGPYVLFETVEGRPTQSILALPLLFVAWVWRSGTRRGWKAPVIAGLLLALCGYQYWYYALFGGLVALGHGLARAWSPPEGAGTQAAVLARHVLMAFVAAVAVLPAAIPLVQQASAGDTPGLLHVAAWDLLETPPVTVEGIHVGLFLWQPLAGSSGFLVQNPDGGEVFLRHAEFLPAISWVLVPLGLLAFSKRDRRTWLAMAAVGLLISFGPVFLLGQQVLPNPVYIAFVKLVSVVQRLWWPARAYAFVAILFGMASAAGLAWLRLRLSTRAWLGALVFSVAAWGVSLNRALLLPFPSWDATVPAGYRCLAEGPEGAIVELPYAWTQAHLYYQTVHGRPMLGGMIENNAVFTPEEATELYEDNTWVKRLRSLARVEREAEDTWDEADGEAMRELGYRYVVVQKDAYHIPERTDTLLDNAMRTRMRRTFRGVQQMLGAPVYEDARVAIFAPFGDPSPCEQAAWDADQEAVGRPDTSAEERVSQDKEDAEVQRIFAAKYPSPVFTGDLDDGDTGSPD